MKEKMYLIGLDSDKYGWSYLWNHTIRQINKKALKIEIIAMILPTLAVIINEDDLDFLQNIKGINSIKEDMTSYLSNI